MLRRIVSSVVVLFSVALFSGSAFAQTTYTWNQTGSASFATAANWTPTRTTPAGNDILVFSNAATTTATGVTAQTIGQLLVSNNTLVTLQAAAPSTLTIAGDPSGTDLSVAAGSQLNFTGTANAITMTVAAGATGSISGSMTLSGTASVAHRLTAASASGITFQSGSTFTQGTNHNGNVFGAGTANSVVFANGSTFTFQSGSNPFALGQPASIVVFQTGSLYRHQSSNTPSFSGRTYANFEMVSGTASPTGTAAVSIDNLTVTGGTLNWNLTATPGHSIKGNISVAAGGTLNFAPASAGTLNLNGGAAQSITNAGTLTINDADQTININNANGVTLGSNVIFNAGTLQFTSGNLTTNANQLVINSGANVNRTSGHVIGNLNKQFTVNGSKVFEVGTANGYSPFTANVTAGTPGSITCAAVQGPQPNMNPATSIARYWPLSASALITADLTFQYLAGDVNGNEAGYQVYRVSGGVPTALGGTINTGAHTATLNGVSTFSDWTVGEAGGPPPPPTLNVGDVTQSEGDPPGTTTFNFQVTLTAPAGASGVTFNWSTADGTTNPATIADNDYVQVTLTPETIASGNSTATLSVTVNRDTTVEPNETFFVNISDVTNATPGDVQGLGTINNDDVVITRIHDVQGNGTASPLAGSSVTARGIVTLLKSNGFFLQEEIGDYDTDTNTSEGIFVFTSSAPTVAVGDDATVTGTVVEFNSLTEISPVTNVTINSTGNTLPTAITLTLADLPTSANFAQPQLEKYEGMRLLATSLVTVAPNDGFFDVYTVLTGQARPFREPGIPASDPIPPDPTSGLPDPNIPVWDKNPERLSLDTNGRAGSTGETLTSNVTLTNVVGPLDFSFSEYRLINEANLTRTADMSAVPVPMPTASQFTVAGYNIENFNNNATQRQKAALTIRDVLRLPDIIGTVEIFDLADLQALATEIQTISGVTYSAHLIEQDGTSEDSDQDVGYLVKTSRVSVTSVIAERTTDTNINPNTSLPELLHDRPPLVLRGTVDPSGPAPLPVVVVVNHLRSFIDIELVAGEGVRVRAKRKAQAESLAGLLQELQTNNPTTPVISVGDYNAFQFNCGYDDSISVLKGNPTPDDQIVVDQSPDLVNPNFYNLIEDVTADQRYSFIFEGTPQALDHMVVNPVALGLNAGIAVARVNADYPSVSAAVYASNAARPEGNSDHDPVVGIFDLPSADVSMSKTLDTAGPYFEGQSVTYTLNVANAGPDAATNIQVTDTPTNLSITSVTGSGCSSLPCTIPSLAAGANTNITVTATIVAVGAFDNSAAANAAESDPISANNTDATGNGGTANAAADVSMNKTLNNSSPYYAGATVTYILDVANLGPSAATNIQVTDTPTNLTITSVSGGGCSSLPCTLPSLANGANVQIFVNATINAAGAFDNSASANGAEFDPVSSNNTDNTGNGDTATLSADVSIAKVLVTGGPYNIGQSVTYTLDVTNAGPSTATTVQVTDTPTNLTITSVSGGGCSALPCTIASIASGATVQITMTATINSVGVFDNSASANGAEPDPNLANNTDALDNGGTTGNAADVSVVKSITTPGPYHQGDVVSFQTVVTNNGPNTATNVQVTDTPIGVPLVAGSISGGGCTSFPCTIPSLANGANVIITYSGTIQNPGSFDNSATVSAAEFDPITSNNSDLFGNGGVAQNTVNVAITKTLDTAGPYFVGQAVTYTLVVSNTGPGVALFVVVTDTPTNLTITSVSGAGCTAFPCTLIPGVTPTPASNRTITVVATINAAGAFDNSATATPRASDYDPNPADNTDNTGNGGTATVNLDTDGDGVADTIEQAAPNGGDGNGDGIPDYQQATVASIPAATGSGYLTLQSSCPLQEVYVTTPAAMPRNDHGFNYPHGLIAFRAPCSSATFSLFAYGSGATSVYRKFGPLPPGGLPQWYELPGATFSTATVGSLHPRRVDFSLTDGGTGDDTPVDGVIVDQGGPAEPSDIPTLSEWALIALITALAAFAALKLRA